MAETVVLTEELIESAQSARGGWSREQLECIGVEWPPPKGWKRLIIGRKIERKVVEKFVGLKNPSADQLSLFGDL